MKSLGLRVCESEKESGRWKLVLEWDEKFGQGVMTNYNMPYDLTKNPATVDQNSRNNRRKCAFWGSYKIGVANEVSQNAFFLVVSSNVIFSAYDLFKCRDSWHKRFLVRDCVVERLCYHLNDASLYRASILVSNQGTNR